MRLLTSATLTSERKRVDDVVGLAAPERQPDQQIAFDIADDTLRDRLGVGKVFWHPVQAQTQLGPPAPRIGRSRQRL